MYNFFIKEHEKNINTKTLIDCYRKILKLLSPFIPHFTSDVLKI